MIEAKLEALYNNAELEDLKDFENVFEVERITDKILRTNQLILKDDYLNKDEIFSINNN